METISESMIQSMEQKGFTYLGIVSGKIIFCNLKSEESVKKCLEFLESITGEEWDIFKESTGNYNLVFYKKSMFQAGDNHLHFKCESETVELPLNCSSCYLMFSDAELSQGFNLGDNFNTSSVKDMRGMFRRVVLPEGFMLGDNFDTSKVTDMEKMFYGAELSEGFTLGDKFNTSNVKNMYFMFEGAKFPKVFSLGDKFDTSNVEGMYCMFCGAKLPEGKSESDFHSDKEIINWLKSRKPSVNQLSAF